jgi:trehalose 6-phosphate phosphatase
MIVLGQYGVERWDAATDMFRLPSEPNAIAAVKDELRSILDAHNTVARVEHKGRAIAIHTRGLDDPGETLRRLSGPLAELAGRHGLVVEPGRPCWRFALRHGQGHALRSIVSGPCSAGISPEMTWRPAAFHAVQEFRDQGVPGLLVCSASTEESALEEISDLLVDGPAGVAAWLNALADAILERGRTTADR